jgi:uncharacterized membrane protein
MSESELNDNHYPNTTSSAPSSEHTATAVRADFGLSFSGYHSPFPPPSVLEGYKAIDPKILAVIMDMTVQEQEHRHSIENKEVEIVEHSRKIEAKAIADDFKFGGRGQWIAFSRAILFFAVISVLALLGMETAVCAAFAAGSLMALSKFFAPRFLSVEQDKTER